MTKIRTAEDILTTCAPVFQMDNDLTFKKLVIQAMQEYAKQFIDLAAEESTLLTCDWCNNRSKSILKLKEMVV